MNMMKKILLVAVLSALVTPAISQSTKSHLHNIDAYAGMGFHSVQFKPKEGGDKNGRVGMTIGANYRLAMFTNVSFSAGLNLTTFSAKSEYDSLATSTTFVDPENGESYEFATEFNNWNEIQKSVNLEIPVGAYYSFALNSNWTLIGGGGLMLDIPVSKKFKTKNGKSDGSMVLSGEFESTNVKYEDLPQHGFSSASSCKGKANMKGAGLSMFVEGGVTHPINNNNAIYIGAYFTQSVTNSLKDCDNDLYNPEKGEYSGIVSSNLVSKTHIMSVGVKVGWSFGLGLKQAGMMNFKSNRKY